MRKQKVKFKNVILVLLCFLVVSCVWTPVDDNYKLRDRRSYNTFENLQDPVVIPVLLSQEFSQGNSDTSTEFFGTALAVYDWESNVVSDYIFTPDRFYSQAFTAVRNSSGIVNHYYFSKDLNIISPAETKLKVEEINSKNLYLSTVDRGYVSEKNLVLPYEKYDGDVVEPEIFNYGIKILDKETGEILDGQDFYSESKVFYITDGDGVVWIVYCKDDVEKKVRNFYMKKWDDESKSFGNEELLCERNYDYEDSHISEEDLDFSNITTYDMVYLDNDYAIISQNVKWAFPSDGQEDKTCFVIVNRNDKSITEVPYNADISDVRIYKLNNQFYVFYTSINDSWETKLMANKLDIVNRALTNCHDFENYSYKNYLFVRNENLYFYSMEFNEVSIWKFDSREEQFQNVIKIDTDVLKALLVD